MGTPGVEPDLSLAGAVTIDDVRAARARLEGVARRTPVATCGHIDRMIGGRVFFKCENLQRVGAFKFRGAFNALSRLAPEERRRGVLAYSSGNHAQAVALAAAILGIPAVIVMPTNAPRTKLEATRSYLSGAPAGSEVVLYDAAREKREEIGARIAQERGLVLVPPYDHPDVIAGQGTAALELFEQVRELGQEGLDELYVCVGGGGLLSGSAIAAKGVWPGCRVIGVEPEAADDATRSFRTRRLHSVSNPETIADGARTPYLGRYTFPLVLTHVDDMMTVSDSELVRAMRLVMERMKLVVEPTGVLALAGMLKRRMSPDGRERGTVGAANRVGVILSGGNVDLDELPRLFAIGS